MLYGQYLKHGNIIPWNLKCGLLYELFTDFYYNGQLFGVRSFLRDLNLCPFIVFNACQFQCQRILDRIYVGFWFLLVNKGNQSRVMMKLWIKLDFRNFRTCLKDVNMKGSVICVIIFGYQKACLEFASCRVELISLKMWE